MEFLLIIFIEAEKTGANNQFYEKFNLRYMIGKIF